MLDDATNSPALMSVGAGPRAIAVNSVTNKIYVANYFGQTVTVIDGATNQTNYDVTADGERFLMIREKTEDAVARQVNVVLAWAEELKKLAKRGTE